MIVNPGKFLATAVASLTQPLFNRGANIAQLRIAKAQQEEARLSFEQTLLNAGSEVNNALVQYQTARDKSVYFNRQVASLENAARSTQLLMKHGNTTYLEVLTAQQTLLNAQLSQVVTALPKSRESSPCIRHWEGAGKLPPEKEILNRRIQPNFSTFLK